MVHDGLDDVLRGLTGDEAPVQPQGFPGRKTLTARLVPRAQIVLRVEDASLARALGGAALARDERGVAPGAEAAVARADASSGAPLPGDVRARFERSLGADLSGVRVHTGSASETAARAVGARAYTTGNDVHFNRGEYRPDDPFGLHLLAHEVAHTVQQAGAAPATQAKLEVTSPGDSLEADADHAADAMVRGEPAVVARGAAAGVARRVVQREPDPAASLQCLPEGEHTVALGSLLSSGGAAAAPAPSAAPADDDTTPPPAIAAPAPVEGEPPAALAAPAPTPAPFDPFAAKNPLGGQTIGKELGIEIARELDYKIPDLPFRITKIKFATKVLKQKASSGTEGHGEKDGANGKVKGAVAVTLKADGSVESSIKREVETRLFTSRGRDLAIKLKNTREHASGKSGTNTKSKLGLELSYKGVAIQIDGNYDLKEWLQRLGEGDPGAFKKPVTITGKLPINLVTTALNGNYEFKGDPEIQVEIAPDAVSLGLGAIATAAARLAPPIALGMGLYELGKGYLTAIVEANTQARVQAVRLDFANGYARAMAAVTETPPEPGEAGDWIAPVHRALQAAELRGEFPDHAAIRQAGEHAVYGAFARAGDPKAFADKVRAAAGYAPGAPRAAREAAVWKIVAAQAKTGDGPIGLALDS